MGLGLHRMSVSQRKMICSFCREQYQWTTRWILSYESTLSSAKITKATQFEQTPSKRQVSFSKTTRNGGTDQAKSAMEKIAPGWYFTTQGHRFRRIKNGPNSSSCITFLPNHHCPKMDSDPAYHECFGINSNLRQLVFGTHRQTVAILAAEKYRWPLWAFWRYSNIVNKKENHEWALAWNSRRFWQKQIM